MALILNPNWPLVALQGAFNADPNAVGTVPSWMDLTDRFTKGGWDCHLGRSYEMNAVETGTANWVLANKDEALNPGNMASRFNQAITPGVVQSGYTDTAATTAASLTIALGTPATAGNWLVVVVSSNTATAIPTGFAQIAATTSASNGRLYLFAMQANGGETSVTVTTASADTFGFGLAEYSGLTAYTPVDVTATARRSASSSASQGTGTTGATGQPLEFVVAAVAPHNFASAAKPTGPVWSSGATSRLGGATGSATAASNCALFVSDRVINATGTVTDTCTWTNASNDAGGLVVAFTATPCLLPYRQLRYWEASNPAGTAPLWGGNFLNDGASSINNGWVTSGSLSDTAGFEGGTVGTWVGANGATVANSVVRAHDGTKSMLVTWPTAGSGQSWAQAAIPPTRTGATYTYSAWVFVPTGSPAVHLNCNGNNGADSAVTNAWTRLFVTFTANDTIGPIFVVTSAASTSGQQVWVDSVQLEAAATASAFTTSGPTVYPVWSGYIERYSEAWEHAGQYGWTKLTSVDALGIVARAELADCMTEDAMQDNPALYWPLSDNPQGGGFCVPSTPFYGVEWIINFNFSVPPRPTDFTMGVTGGPGVDADPCVQFSATSSSQPSLWMGPSFNSPAVYAIGDTGSGMTWELWFQTTGTSQVVLAGFVSNTSASHLEIGITATGNVVAQVAPSIGSPVYTIIDPGISNDGTWHYVAVTETASGSVVTATLQVDARIAGTATRTDTAALGTVQVYLAYGQYTASPFPSYAGRLSRVAIYQRALSATRQRSHWASSLGFPWDTTGQRVGRVIGWIPWNGRSSIDVGHTDVSPASGLSRTFASAHVNACAITEQGAFFAAPDGTLLFWGRDRFYLRTTPTVTFGENTAGGEIPYLGDVTFDLDPQLIYNDVTVTPASGTAAEVADVVSQRRYGVASGSASTIHRFSRDATSLAQHLLRRYRQPQLRPSTITVNVAANPSVWPPMLALRFGDRVRVNRRSQGVTTTVDGYIDEIKHAGGPGSRTVQVRVAPADNLPPFILGDPVYGVLGGPGVVQY